MSSGGRPTTIQATTRPENLWPEIWTNIGKVVEKKEEHEWANEKPKLDDAWRLRGVYFIDLEDADFKETSKIKEKVGSSNGGGNAVQKK